MCETSMRGNRREGEMKGTDEDEGATGCNGQSTVLVSLQ